MGWYVLYAIGLFTAILTGFYIFRLIFGVFFGAYRGGAIAAHGEHGAPTRPRGAGDPLANVREVGPAMMIPMVVLGVLSVIGGFYGTPWADAIGTFLEPSTHTTNLGIPTGQRPVLGGVRARPGDWPHRHRDCLGTLCPARTKVRGVAQSAGRAAGSSILHRQSLRRRLRAASGGHRAGCGASGWRRGFFDGGSHGVGLLVGGVSKGLRRLQTGYARNYALAIFVGAALILVYYVIRPK